MLPLVATVVVVLGCSGTGAVPPTPPSVAPAAPTASPSPTVAVSSPTPATAVAGIPSRAPAATSRPGNGRGVKPGSSLRIGGARPVTVRIPGSYDPSRPAPLLLALHGTGGDGAGVEAYLDLGDEAARLGFVYALPDGTLDANGDSFWNATDACCDFFGSGVDDSAYLHKVIESIRDRVAVDPKRIYVIGHSNGGFMSYRLACDHADDIAAIVSLAGATYDNRRRCSPDAAVSVLEIHGTADVSVHYRGGTLPTPVGTRTMAPYPGAQSTVQTWAVYDGCDRAPAPLAIREDVATGLSGPHGPDEATMQVWSGCRPGAGVELWTVPGGPHGPALSRAFPGAVLGFLLAHPKP